MVSRYRVVTTRVKRVAMGYAPGSHTNPFENAVSGDGFIGILGAGRHKAAG